jgi:hypothetical protein
MKTASIEKIEEGIRELIEETKVGNEDLTRRSKVFLALDALIFNLKGHTQRRLTGKLQPNPDAQVEELFRRYNFLLGRIQ